MSSKELDRIKVIETLANRLIRQSEAAALLGLSVRQIKRLLKSYRAKGSVALLRQPKKNPTSSRSYDESFRQNVLGLLQGEAFQGFGSTFAREKLSERHGIHLSIETIRQWRIAAGAHYPKERRFRKAHPLRQRRPCFGELIQIDGSIHDWFEGRGPRCTLLVFIDDATSQIVHLSFVEAETTLNYMQSMWAYILRYGKPMAIYSDKHGVFSVNAKEPVSGTGITQFTRALQALSITPILAHSPQAKGRVERCNRTLQDRLVKELRLRTIASIEEANAFLETFRVQHNAQFAIQAASPINAHRPLEAHEQAQLSTHFSVQTTRKVSKRLTVQHHNKVFQLALPAPSYHLQQNTVLLCEHLDGNIEIIYKNKSIPYTVFSKGRKAPALLDSKGIDPYFLKMAGTQSSIFPIPFSEFQNEYRRAL